MMRLLLSVAFFFSLASFGESLLKPTYNGRSTFEAPEVQRRSPSSNYSDDTGPFLPRGNQAWDRHVTDRHHGFEQQKQCNEDGCLITHRERFNYERLDQYYRPHGQSQPVPQGRVASQPFYFVNATRSRCRFTVAYYNGQGQSVTETFDINPGQTLLVGHVASGSTYGVVGRLDDGRTYNFQRAVAHGSRFTQSFDNR